MPSQMKKEYRLDDLLLSVRLQYDESSGRYLEEIPDFEDNPVFTADGKPVVCAAQDACANVHSTGNYRCMDCGCCSYFEMPNPDSLIGLCGHPIRRKKVHRGQEEEST